MRRLLVALLALAAGVTVVVAVDDEGRPTVTVRVDGPDRDTRADDKLVVPPLAQEVEEKVEDGELHKDVALDVVRPLRGPDRQPVGLEPGTPLASQSWPGCSTRFVRSFSGRGGQTIKAIGLHYTAGPNLPGLADMLGLTSYSNRNQVSWHFLIDRDGNCFYSVPTNHKAWTISDLNGQTVNIEVVGRGNEPGYAGTAGFKKLTAVVRRIGRVHNVPMRLGAVRNCNVTRRGIITHWQGGPCSGGHHDIRPYDIATVVQRIRTGGVKPPSKAAVSQCKQLNRYRRTYSRLDQPQRERAKRLRRNLVRHRYVCQDRGGRTILRRR